MPFEAGYNTNSDTMKAATHLQIVDEAGRAELATQNRQIRNSVGWFVMGAVVLVYAGRVFDRSFG
jgi:hypothetical protein